MSATDGQSTPANYTSRSPPHNAKFFSSQMTIQTQSETTEIRRHDLDALRGFAMLLGIVLHCAMSFLPGIIFIWGVQDIEASEGYGILLGSIHGWRMQLFFLISGFFTAMLWRKRGSRALFVHRFQRIFLPLCLSMVTIIPLLLFVSGYVRMNPINSLQTNPVVLKNSETTETAADSNEPTRIDIWKAVMTDDSDSVKKYIREGGNVNLFDPENGSTLLHAACFFGKPRSAQALLDGGADLLAIDDDGNRPDEALLADWETTNFIANLVGLPLDQDELSEGREQIAKSISEQTGKEIKTAGTSSDAEKVIVGIIAGLFFVPFFHHLWFLWFLCWFVLLFLLFIETAKVMRLPAIPEAWLHHKLRYLFLIPLTAIPQFFMAREPNGFGPDTSIGLIPLPTVFLYYLIFFSFGALMFPKTQRSNQANYQFLFLLAAGAIIFVWSSAVLKNPVSNSERIIFAIAQSTYSWLMTFGMIGLFTRFFSAQRTWVRYLSDSSYWLYIAHLPLVLLLQYYFAPWQFSSPIKFLTIIMITTAVLLISYQIGVRNTWIGLLLNGRRYPGKSKIKPEPLPDTA
ncbi:acyltransferase family protein [Rubripirellula sp.]|nr:acyltransferase family protein [Rubripirellula sp.]